MNSRTEIKDQIQFTTNGVTVLAVRVPYIVKHFKIYRYTMAGDWLGDAYPNELNAWKSKLPKGNWKLHCVTDNITEEQAKVLVDTIPIEIAPSPCNDFSGDCDYGYIDYENKGEYAGWNGDAGYFRKAISSFQSLLRSHGIDPKEKRVLLIKPIEK